MGLDMYLNKKTYVKNWNQNPSKYSVVVTLDGKVVDSIKPDRVKYIEEEVAYWRKANAIHKFFVDQCQDGVDDCREAYVDIDTLKELVSRCKQILEDRTTCEDLLPPESGFFFGGTDCDEWYFDSIQNTIEMIEPLLSESEDGEFYYHSSW